MKLLLTIALICHFSLLAQAQQWIDTLYTIESFLDIEYGTATDFAGNERSLKLDISVPVDDSIPACGRPLLIAIHGGAFLAGSKNDGGIKSLREDFAQRGYVTAAITYRLGMFPPENEIHCNIEGWDCFNVADTSEWFRALYRGVQDTKGAIRYLINRADEYQIDPQNVFLVGESAGGFIALATAFWNEPNEIPVDVGTLDAVNAPHAIYENQCIQGLQLDTSIASMQFDRPDLGAPDGPLNPSETEFRIRGVGSFYGGMMGNYFDLETDTVFPALYLFHQPNDLLVPFNYNRLLSGYMQCAISLAGCGYIVNRPYVYGGRGIVNLIDTLIANGAPAPEYQFEQTNNTADCLFQIINPSLAGHALDSYWIRSRNMATFFGAQVDCTEIIDQVDEVASGLSCKVFPNPAKEKVILEMSQAIDINYVQLISLAGKTVLIQEVDQITQQVAIDLKGQAAPGLYVLKVHSPAGDFFEKLIIR